MYKVAIADDHKLFRKGLAGILSDSPEIEVVIEAPDGRALLDAMESVVPDVVLLDLEMPVLDGQQTLKAIKESFPDVRTVILTMHTEENFIIDLMDSGANGYLLKDAEPEELEKAIRSVVQNDFYFSAKVSQVMLSGLARNRNRKPQTSETPDFTERELDVLRLVCREQTTPEIAQTLFLSPRTIEGYRQQLMEKTGAKNSAGLVVYAARTGLLEQWI